MRACPAKEVEQRRTEVFMIPDSQMWEEEWEQPLRSALLFLHSHTK